MKRKDVELVINWPFILSPKSPCVHIADCAEGWFRFAMRIDASAPITVCDAWCYRGIWIFAYVVPGVLYWCIELGRYVDVLPWLSHRLLLKKGGAK